MKSDGRRDDDGIQLRILNQVFKATRGLDGGIQLLHVAEPGFAEIANRLKTTTPQVIEVADQVGAPIAAANHANVDLLVSHTQMSAAARLQARSRMGAVGLTRVEVREPKPASQI